MPPTDATLPPGRHWHVVVRHTHPDWHGHCKRVWVETPSSSSSITRHNCERTHWHFLFRHRHTEDGR